MSAALGCLLENQYVVFTGWTLLMILWQTTVIGAVFAIWRLAQHRHSARRHYAAAVVAFSTAVIVAFATPLALLVVAPASEAAAAVPGHGQRLGARPNTPDATSAGLVPGSPRAGSLTPVSVDAVAAVAASVWASGVFLLTIRLLGGWIVVRRIARTARPVVPLDLSDAIDTLRSEAGLRVPVPVLQSNRVDAPVVMGWRHPLLILPDQATSLTPDTLTPLLAHEIAHIRRRDYVANLCQSAVELLLFFSPAVIWISRRIREAREFCCDDAAVIRCGDAKYYVHALTALARLGAMHTEGPTLGAAGPRLITRVRRLLQEEPMPKFSSARIGGLIVAVAVLLVVGMRVSAASAARVPTGGARAAFVQNKFPYGWQTEQEGSGVSLANFVSTAEAPTQSVTVRNLTEQPVVGVQFIAAIEQLSNGTRPPVRLVSSELLSVAILAGQAAAVSPQVLSAEQLQQIAFNAGGAQIQFFFGVQRVKFANGFEWSITPNPAATSGPDALGIPRPVYARELIPRDANHPEVPFGACRDERNRPTSHGGLVPILNEPGKFMRCQNGRWVESADR